jgi:hypothetical protein
MAKIGRAKEALTMSITLQLTQVEAARLGRLLSAAIMDTGRNDLAKTYKAILRQLERKERTEES